MKVVSTCIATVAASVALSAAATDTYTLRMGHIYQATHFTGETATEFANLVNERTDGRLNIQVFPASQLGSEQDMVEALTIGTLDMTAPGSSILGEFQQQFYVVGAPFLWESQENIHKVLSSDIGKVWEEELEASQGLRAISYWDRVPRHLHTKEPLLSPEELEGVRIRVPDNPLWIETWRAFGALPTPVALAEVYLALQQGIVDAYEASTSYALSSGLHEVADHTTQIGYLREVNVVLISNGALDRLPDDLQTTLLELAKEFEARATEIAAGDVAVSEGELATRGHTFHEVDLAPWMERATAAVEALAERWGGMELYEDIQSMQEN